MVIILREDLVIDSGKTYVTLDKTREFVIMKIEKGVADKRFARTS